MPELMLLAFLRVVDTLGRRSRVMALLVILHRLAALHRRHCYVHNFLVGWVCFLLQMTSKGVIVDSENKSL